MFPSSLPTYTNSSDRLPGTRSQLIFLLAQLTILRLGVRFIIDTGHLTSASTAAEVLEYRRNIGRENMSLTSDAEIRSEFRAMCKAVQDLYIAEYGIGATVTGTGNPNVFSWAEDFNPVPLRKLRLSIYEGYDSQLRTIHLEPPLFRYPPNLPPLMVHLHKTDIDLWLGKRRGRCYSWEDYIKDVVRTKPWKLTRLQ